MIKYCEDCGQVEISGYAKYCKNCLKEHKNKRHREHRKAQMLEPRRCRICGDWMPIPHGADSWLCSNCKKEQEKAQGVRMVHLRTKKKTKDDTKPKEVYKKKQKKIIEPYIGMSLDEAALCAYQRGISYGELQKMLMYKLKKGDNSAKA